MEHHTVTVQLESSIPGHKTFYLTEILNTVICNRKLDRRIFLAQNPRHENIHFKEKPVYLKYSLVCVFPIAFLFSYLLECSGEVWLLKLK